MPSQNGRYFFFFPFSLFFFFLSTSWFEVGVAEPIESKWSTAIGLWLVGFLCAARFNTQTHKRGWAGGGGGGGRLCPMEDVYYCKQILTWRSNDPRSSPFGPAFSSSQDEPNEKDTRRILDIIMTIIMIIWDPYDSRQSFPDEPKWTVVSTPFTIHSRYQCIETGEIRFLKIITNKFKKLSLALPQNAPGRQHGKWYATRLGISTVPF